LLQVSQQQGLQDLGAMGMYVEVGESRQGFTQGEVRVREGRGHSEQARARLLDVAILRVGGPGGLRGGGGALLIN
jgi:hypothetical protein